MSDFWINKYGRNIDVDAAEDIWDGGSNYLFPAVAFATQIVGGANDDVSSNGVHSVEIEGLDINGIEITEVATLTGATPVTLANSFYRVNRAYIKAVGANQINSFDISISHVGSATLSKISAEEGQTLQCVYTLPAGVRGNIAAWRANAARIGNKTDVSASMRLQTRVPGEGWRTKDSAEIINGVAFAQQYVSPQSITVAPMTDIRLRCTAINTNDVAISGGFEITGFRDIR